MTDDIYTKDSIQGAIDDFHDPEQSIVVRLQKLKWGLQGIVQGIEQVVARGVEVPEDVRKSLELNKAQQEFVDILITHMQDLPQPELLTESDTQRFIEDVDGYLPKPEHDKFQALLKGAQLKYDKLRRHPLLEIFKKLGTKSQKKLMNMAEKMERKENNK